MTEEQLEQLIRACDSHKLVAALKPLSEAERKQLAKKAAALYRELTPNQNNLMALMAGGNLLRIWEPQSMAGLAMLGLCGWTDAKKWRPDRRRFLELTGIEEVLRDREPDWLEKWVAQEMESDRGGDWNAVRALVREELCSRPTTHRYIRKMLHALAFGRRGQPLASQFEEDPGLLEHEVWQIFETDFGDEPTLIASEFEHGHLQDGWGPTLVKMSAEGKVDRGRLLTACLDALNRKHHPSNAGWFARVHEELKPTLAERLDRQRKYADLLLNSVPAVIGFAVEALKVIAQADKLNTDATVEGLSSALAIRQKGHALSAARLLKSCAKNTSDAAKVARTAAVGLEHPAVEVQQVCLEILEQVGIAGAEQDVSARLDAVAASLRSRVEALVGAAVVETPSAEDDSPIAETEVIPQHWRTAAGIDDVLRALNEGGALLPPPVLRRRAGVGAGAINDGFTANDSTPTLTVPRSTGGGDQKGHEFIVPRLDPAQTVEPIGNMDELIERLSSAVETLESSIELDLLMDGISGFTTRPADFAARTAPLLQRVTAVVGHNQDIAIFGNDPKMKLCAMIRAWIMLAALPTTEEAQASLMSMMRTVGQNLEPQRWIEAFLSARMSEVVLGVLQDNAGPLLALPTHVGSWIDPRILIQRIIQRNNHIPRHDLLAAMLRLAPEHRDEALKQAGALPGEEGAALRYALGGDESIGKDAALWITSARARTPFGSIPELTAVFGDSLGPDAAEPAVYSWSFEKGQHVWESESTLRLTRVPPLPKKLAPPDHPTILRHYFEVGFWAMSSIAAIRCRAAVWPMNLEAFFAQGAVNIAARINNPASTMSPTAQYLEPLFDQDVPLGLMAQLAVCLGLLSKDAGTRGTSIDVLIALISDGRCVGTELGTLLAEMSGKSKIVRLNRIAETLEQISRAGASHRYVCACVGESFLITLGTRKLEVPGDLHHLLRPLREWLTALGSGPGAKAREFLETVKATGKTGNLVKALLAMPTAMSVPRAAASEALRGRVERGRQWMARL